MNLRAVQQPRTYWTNPPLEYAKINRFYMQRGDDWSPTLSNTYTPSSIDWYGVKIAAQAIDSRLRRSMLLLNLRRDRR